MRKPAPQYPSAPWTFGEYIAWRDTIEEEYQVRIGLAVYELREDSGTSWELELNAVPCIDGEPVAGCMFFARQRFHEHHRAIDAAAGANLLFALRSQLEDAHEAIYLPL